MIRTRVSCTTHMIFGSLMRNNHFLDEHLHISLFDNRISDLFSR